MATFRERYLSIRDRKELTPKQKFIEEICGATMKCEKTVRCWIAETQMPDPLAQRIISEKVGVPPEELFPRENYNYPRRKQVRSRRRP